MPELKTPAADDARSAVAVDETTEVMLLQVHAVLSKALTSQMLSVS
jgi:hypothetical protein